MDEQDRSHRRFFVLPSQIHDAEVIIEGQDARQIGKVLRLRTGDGITVLDGSGASHSASITKISKTHVTARILRTDYPDTEPSVYLALAQALPKGCKLELIVQKACELGISEVTGLITERTICRPVKEKYTDRIDRWQRVAKEAAEQCSRAKIPSVRGIIALEELAGQIPSYDLAIVAHEDEKSVLLSTVLQTNRSAGRVLLVVGPEGGFTEDEVALLSDRGAKPVSLGKRVLRAETAAIAACAVIMNSLEGHL